MKHWPPWTPSVRERSRTIDEMDRKIVAHVREYGRVTNRTVQNMFDFDVQRARDVLADLVGRRVLKKTSAAQRGPSVEYGRGTRFPPLGRGKQRSREPS